MLEITFEKFNEFAEKTKRIEEFLENKYNADKDTAYSVKLAVFELAGNILKHSKSKAYLNMRCEGDIIKIYINGGKVFNFDNIALPEDTSEHGRGMFIVKNICESLEYSDGGRQVCVCIKRRQKQE